MKLRNKLIPLLSVVTAAGVVAPIATSCGYTSNVVTDIELTDITHNYVPTIAKAKKVTEEMTDVDAQDLYFEHLAQNPEILKQDVLKYQADYLPTRIKYIEYYNDSGLPYYDNQRYVAKNVTANVGVENVSFRKIKCVDAATAKETFFYALSCDIQYKFTFTALRMDGQYSLDANLNFKASLKDIPTIVYSEIMYNPTAPETQTQERRWRVSNVFTENKWLDAVPGWSYTFARNDSVTETTIDQTGAKTSQTSNTVKDGVINRKDQIADLIKEGYSEYYDEFLEFESYHLSDVTAVYETLPLELAVDGKGILNGNISESADKGEYSYDDSKHYSIKNFELFRNIDSELLEKFDKYDTVTFYFGDLEENIPTSYEDYFSKAGTEYTGGTELLQNDSSHSIIYDCYDQYFGEPTKIFENIESDACLSSKLFFGKSINEYAPGYSFKETNFEIKNNSIFAVEKTDYTSEYRKIPTWKIGIDYDQLKQLLIDKGIPEENLFNYAPTITSKFTVNDTLTFTAIEAGTYIGYACANSDDPESFVCKTARVSKDIPITIKVIADEE